MHRLAVVVVHYRTPELVAPAVTALHEDAAAAALEIELVIVDNGGGETEHARWRALPAKLMAPGENLGYAGGVRAGVEASAAPLVVAMNPDVEVRRGCLARLAAALDDGADAAGPKFCWDAAGRILLPPTEERTAAAELLAALAARRLGPFERRARRRWRKHARRHWLAERAIDSFHLSGALLAFRREAWRRVGPFDAGYRLYFEETDWLLRLRKQGGRARFVGDALAAHWHAQSSLLEPAAADWFAAAERRFRARHYGAPTAALLARLGRRAAGEPESALAAPSIGAEPPWLDGPALGVGSAGSWIEMSPLARGLPAAGEYLAGGAGSWSLAADVWRRAGTPALFVRGVSAGGAESRAFVYPPPGAAEHR